MPKAQVNGLEYSYIDEGAGSPVVFAHGLAADKHMFDAQIAHLRDRYRCVSVDLLGHGETSTPATDFTLEDQAEDVASLCAALGIEKAVFAGLSQGGMTFMRLALAHPELVQGLVLMDTSAAPEDAEMVDQYIELAETARSNPTDELAQVVQKFLYSEQWLRDNPEQAKHERDVILSHDPEGVYKASMAIFRRGDIRERLGQIKAPTLVIVGEQDVATPPEKAEEIAAAIEGAELVRIPGAGHHSPIERPQPVTEALEQFLARVVPARAPA